MTYQHDWLKVLQAITVEDLNLTIMALLATRLNKS